MSYDKLKGKITEVFKTRAAFAEALEINNASLSSKLNNKTPWKREEIQKACELLGIPIEQVHVYFFTPKVEKAQL